MNKDQFITELSLIGFTISDIQINMLEKYLSLMTEYNNHTNLTTIIKPEDVYLKHFYDSLAINKIIDLEKEKNLLDIGSGAGFPGLVIAIMVPHLQVTLLDSNAKKCRFLLMVKEALNLKNVDIVCARSEDYALNNLESFSLVTARAVASLRILSELAIPFLKLKGHFIALKSHIADEFEDAKPTIHLLGGVIETQKYYELPNAGGSRTLISIQKNKKTPSGYPRPYDKILKKPLKKSIK